jgi:membrane-associated phospholipid phosphatase
MVSTLPIANRDLRPRRSRAAAARGMSGALPALLATVLIFCAKGYAQNLPISPAARRITAAQAAARAGALPVRDSARALPRAILQDQKSVFSFPIRAVEGRHWKPALAVTLATASLIALDSRDAPYFRRTTAFGCFNRALSGRTTALGMAAVPLATLLVGWRRHDSYSMQTAMEAGEAAADSQLLALGLKMISRRLRPSDIAPTGDFGHTWFKSNRALGFNSSFPSGHTLAAFSVATVFSERYRRHRWVPWVAYGAAALVGFSRISLQAHFPADVFAGAALGYSLSHFVVLRRR